MSLAQLLTRPVSIRAGGRDWPLLFTHRALLEIERLTGLDVMGGGLNSAKPSARVIRSMLTAATGAPDADILEAFALPRLTDTRRIVCQAWVAAMPEPQADTKRGADSKPSKPLAWLDAWAIADHDLGLTQDEWLDMTPRMVHALIDRHLEQIRQWELMIGMVIANNANFSACAPKQALQPSRFMLHPWPETPKAPMTGADIMAAFAPLRAKGLLKRA